jgi:hypothetical protein
MNGRLSGVLGGLSGVQNSETELQKQVLYVAEN